MAQHGAALLSPLSMAPSLLSGAFPPLRPSPPLPPPSGGGGEGRVRRQWRWRRLATSLSLSLSPEDPSSSSPSTLHPLFTVSAVADELAVAQVWARLTERIGSRKRVGS